MLDLFESELMCKVFYQIKFAKFSQLPKTFSALDRAHSEYDTRHHTYNTTAMCIWLVLADHQEQN